MKDKLENVKGRKTPDYIILRINRSKLKNLPDSFYMDLTIDDVRDMEANKK